MFKKILVALDHSNADAALLPRVKELARLTRAGVLLIHVSTGWAAQWQSDLNLSDSREMQEDREYLERVRGELEREGFEVEALHALGKPSDEILKAARTKNCDVKVYVPRIRETCAVKSRRLTGVSTLTFTHRWFCTISCSGSSVANVIVL